MAGEPFSRDDQQRMAMLDLARQVEGSLAPAEAAELADLHRRYDAAHPGLAGHARRHGGWRPSPRKATPGPLPSPPAPSASPLPAPPSSPLTALPDLMALHPDAPLPEALPAPPGTFNLSGRDVARGPGVEHEVGEADVWPPPPPRSFDLSGRDVARGPGVEHEVGPGDVWPPPPRTFNLSSRDVARGPGVEHEVGDADVVHDALHPGALMPPLALHPGAPDTMLADKATSQDEALNVLRDILAELKAKGGGDGKGGGGLDRKALGRMGQKGGEAWSGAAIGVKGGAQAAGQMLRGNPAGAIGAIGSTFSQLGGALGPAGTAMQAAVGAGQALYSAFKALGDEMIRLASAASPVAAMKWRLALDDLTATMGRVFVPVLELWTTEVRLLGDVLATILPDTKSISEALAPWHELYGSIRQSLNDLAPAWRALSGYIDGFHVATNNLFNPVKKLMELFNWGAQKLATAIKVLQALEILPTGSGLASSVGASMQSAAFTSLQGLSQSTYASAFSLGSGANGMPQQSPAERAAKAAEDAKKVLDAISQFVEAIAWVIQHPGEAARHEVGNLADRHRRNFADLASHLSILGWSPF